MEDFVLNTEYPADKIVWLEEGTISANAGQNTIQLPNPFGVNLFVRGVWSRDGFNNSYNFGIYGYTESNVLDFNTYITSDTSQITANIYLNSGATVKYRLWGVVNEAETQNLDINGTATDTTNRFIVNTEYNLPRLYAEGYASPNTDFVHNLGFIPFVDIWAFSQFSNNWEFVQISSFGSVFGDGTKVDSSKIHFGTRNFNYTNFYYRVYV